MCGRYRYRGKRSSQLDPGNKAPKHVAIFFMLTPIVCHEISDAPFAIRIDNNADLALALGSDGLHKRLACP